MMTPRIRRRRLVALTTPLVVAGALVAAAAPVAAAASSCDAVAGNLVVNCGFETATLRGWTLTPTASKVASVPHTGAYSVELNSGGLFTTGYLSQVLATASPGTTYRLEFDARNLVKPEPLIPVGFGFGISPAVLPDGSVGEVFPAATRTPPDGWGPRWMHFAATFTTPQAARFSPPTLKFWFISTVAAPYYLDDVQVTRQARTVPTIDAVVNSDRLAGRPVTVRGHAQPGGNVRLRARNVTTHGSFATVGSTVAAPDGSYRFTTNVAYNSTLVVSDVNGTSSGRDVLVRVKVTIDSVAYRYTDSRGRCVVRFAGGTYPYIPGAPVYIRTTSGVPVGSTSVTRLGASGRYSALFGLSCARSYTLFSLISGRSATGAVYTLDGTGSPVSFRTPR